jgi:hypothetical protein
MLSPECQSAEHNSKHAWAGASRVGPGAQTRRGGVDLRKVVLSQPDTDKPSFGSPDGLADVYLNHVNFVLRPAVCGLM